MNNTKKSITIPYGSHQVTLETGECARQANASVLVSVDGTCVLSTVVAKATPLESVSFLPMSVHYQERTYAAGKIPGGYFKREGKPTEKEVLTSRLIDRPIRPLFPEGFAHEVQVISTVVSLNPEVDPDIVALIGSAAACALSGLPLAARLAAARVGLIDGDYVLNPTKTQLQSSSLDLIIAGSDQAIMMVESQVGELSEQQMLDALQFGHNNIKQFIAALTPFIEENKQESFAWTPPALPDKELLDAVHAFCKDKITEAYAITQKQERVQKLRMVAEETVEHITASYQSKEEEAPTAGAIKTIISDYEYDHVRQMVIKTKKRIDGRALDEVRPITAKVSYLPRTHGSALFTRGDTQALVATTLGTDHDSQLIDALEGDYRDKFMLHYNFPPFSTGEVGRMIGPGRREIGHGKLAKRALMAVMPDPDSCPYTIRVVSDILESNGSSSMASVCGASLSLLDAGVELRAPVAGIAMGLVKEESDYSILSDILGDEDHLGDMDFKVAGTQEGITALQMDIKINGITVEIMEQALAQAKAGRLHILEIMNAELDKPRTDVSEFAPRFITLKINPDKIRDIIGKGGVTIRSITEETGVDIKVEDDGTVKIASVDKVAGEAAKKRIEDIAADLEVGKVYSGTVARIMEYGAFVTVVPGKDGLVHISQVSEERIENLNDVLSAGDKVNVRVLEIDKQGRVRLTMRDVESPEAG